MKPGLAALIHPAPAPQFFLEYLANKPFVMHGLKATVKTLTALPFLQSLDALLNSWPNQVQAHLPDVRDEASAVEASTQDARKLFANGMGLLFDNAHAHVPLLGQWLDAIRADLGLSALTYGRCLIYATPKGGGTAPHCDQNVNFVLQLHGTKTWWIAPNRHVENPLTRHTMGQPADPELQTYARVPLPTRMPAGSRAVVLKPGSLLCVPRGAWHSTRATTDALSLNFTYAAPTWLDLLTAALRSRLALSSAWRETALPASPEAFDMLLRELAYDVPHWTAADILDATEGR